MTDRRTCPACGASDADIRYREKLGDWFCDVCDHSWAGEPSADTARPLRIFLSYGHDRNEELVRRMKSDLEARGHDVWLDQNEIKAGDDWRRSITDGIVASDRVLSFLSKHSTRDPGVCLDEIAIAIGASRLRP